MVRRQHAQSTQQFHHQEQPHVWQRVPTSGYAEIQYRFTKPAISNIVAPNVGTS